MKLDLKPSASTGMDSHPRQPREVPLQSGPVRCSAIAGHLVDLLHRHRDEWTGKILPVVLPGRSPEEIPLSFLPGTADHYVVTSITDEGAASLLRVLLHHAAT
jgi:hypothetical protein